MVPGEKKFLITLLLERFTFKVAELFLKILKTHEDNKK